MSGEWGRPAVRVLAAAALAAWGSGCAAAVANARVDAELRAALDSADWRVYGSHSSWWEANGLPALSHVLEDLAGERKAPRPGIPELVARLEHEYGLDREAARHLLAAALVGSSETCQWSRCASAEDRERVGSHLLEAARLSPGNKAAAVAAVDFAGTDARAEALLSSVLDAAPDPQRRAWEMAAAAWEGSVERLRLLGYLLTRSPGSLARALELEKACRDRGVAVCLAGLEQVLSDESRSQDVSVPRLFDATARSVVAFGAHGILLRLWTRLLSAEQREVLRLARAAPGDDGGAYAVGLSAVMLLAGDRSAASDLFTAAADHPVEGCRERVQRGVLAFHLKGTAFGPAYDTLVCLMRAGEDLSPAWVVLADDMWTESGIAVTADLGQWALHPVLVGPEPSPAFARTWAELEDGNHDLLRRMTALMAASESRATGGSDPAATTVARVLGREPFRPFVEHSMTKDPPVAGPPWKAADRKLVSTRLVVAPEEVVRAEQLGSHVVALTITHDVDSFITHGGYWFHESMDGGQTWLPPTYTGLTELLPYYVVRDSKLPLVHEGMLRIEVQVAEIDPTSITLPLSFSLGRIEKELWLQARLEDLRRDTDRDGLTDVLEDRLLTDRENPDSDGDGLLDGADPLPHVPRVEVATPADRERVLLMRAIFGDECGRAATTSPTEELPHTDSPDWWYFQQKRGLDWQLLVVPRQRLRSVPLPFRAVVLTAEEVARARERVGLSSSSMTIVAEPGGKHAALGRSGFGHDTTILERKGDCWAWGPTEAVVP